MIEKIPNTSSITIFLKEYKKILEKVIKKQETLLLLNHNTPLCVILSVGEYNRLAANYKELEDERRVQKLFEWEKHRQELFAKPDWEGEEDEK